MNLHPNNTTSQGPEEADDNLGGESADAGTAADKRRRDDPLLDVGVKALGAIGTGVGVLGFVTLVGGAIFYAQMSAVGLPSDQIVSAMPQSALLVVGARFIIPVLVFVWIGLAGLRIAELITDRGVTHRVPSCPAGPDDVNQTETGASNEPHAGAPNVARAKNYFREVLDWPRSLGLFVLGVVEAIFVVRNLGKAGSSALAYVVLLLIEAVLLSAIWFFGIRGRPRPSFAVYAITVSTAAALFAASFATTLASVGPVVRAVVIERIDGPPISGIYAAANSTAVMIGEVCQQSRDSRRGSKRSGFMTIVPRSHIKQMFVTTNGSLGDALTRERVLLGALHVKTGGLGRCTEPGPPETLYNHAPLQGVPGVLQGP